MSWRVVLAKSAEKQLRRLPLTERSRVASAIDVLGSNPFGGDVVKLAGKGNAWRLRVGNYRIIFELFPKEKVLFIYDIARRTSSTYK